MRVFGRIFLDREFMWYLIPTLYICVIGTTNSSIQIRLNASFPANLDTASHPVGSFSISSNDSPLTPGLSLVVDATYADSISVIGQARFSASTVANRASTDRDYFYALGLAEGYLTAERVIQQLYNVVWSKPRQSSGIYEFLSSQYTYMQKRSEESWRDDSFWFQVGMSLARMDGLMDGIQARQQEAMQTDRKKQKGDEWQYYPVTYMALYELNSNA